MTRERLFARRFAHPMAALACAALCGLPTSILAQAPAPSIKPEPAPWSTSADFAKSTKARINLSGAACAPTLPRLQSCLIVNDDKKYAQAFSIKDRLIQPGRVIRLIEDGGDPDAEAAAYQDGHFYVTGSHGRRRHHPDDRNAASYVVFRFPVDKATAQPVFIGDEEVERLEQSLRLGEALRKADRIAAYVDQPLERSGVNIEGLAVKGGRMYFGLRGPSIDSEAFIVSVDKDALFTRDQPLRAEVHALKLGAQTGIRDLAVVKDGLLILSGPVNEQTDVKPAVFLWRDNRELTKLGELQPLPIQSEVKAETLLVLQDDEGTPVRVLVMFDGPENGSPTEYLLRR
jgi:hypothetical protein